VRVVVFLVLCTSCSRDLGIEKDVGVAKADTASLYDCQGLIDSCEKEACEACVEECSSECEAIEVSPMEFSCSDRQWKVYDVCPDWSEEDTGQE